MSFKLQFVRNYILTALAVLPTPQSQGFLCVAHPAESDSPKSQRFRFSSEIKRGRNRWVLLSNEQTLGGGVEIEKILCYSPLADDIIQNNYFSIR